MKYVYLIERNNNNKILSDFIVNNNNHGCNIDYLTTLLVILHNQVATYTPYEGLNLTNQISRKLEVFYRKLEGNHSKYLCYHIDVDKK